MSRGTPTYSPLPKRSGIEEKRRYIERRWIPLFGRRRQVCPIGVGAPMITTVRVAVGHFPTLIRSGSRSSRSQNGGALVKVRLATAQFIVKCELADPLTGLACLIIRQIHTTEAVFWATQKIGDDSHDLAQ